MKNIIVILILRSKQYYRVVAVLTKSLEMFFCIFARFKVNCKVMPLHSFANLKSIMSRHRKELRGTLGHTLLGLCVTSLLCVTIRKP